jgi:hypothetical protein
MKESGALEKLIVAGLVKKFLAFYANETFIIVLTVIRHCNIF